VETLVTRRVEKSDEAWREELSAEAYRVLREKGTEAPFTGVYWNAKEPGTYRCRGCGTALFTSETKYDSGTGWPSFYEPISVDVVRTEEDISHGMRRIEVVCGTCGGHLGHLFPDGPAPTGQRYCLNSAALELDPEGG
jgi:peptide-methionine (R)-S-oxide reductase